MKLDDEEKEIICRECNGYLWSVSIYDDVPEVRRCPYLKDPCGNCTGLPKTDKRPEASKRAVVELLRLKSSLINT